MIPIYKPYIGEKSIKYSKDAIDSSWISSQGKYTFLVLDRLLNLIDTKHCILTNNGTSATHLMSIGLKYKYPEIKNLIVPSNVFIAAWNSFKMSEDYNFICLDSDLDTWNSDYSDLSKIIDYPNRINDKDFLSYLDNNPKYNNKNTAFLIVHNIGNIINVPKLKRKYKDYIFLEDNCEGFLGNYEEKNTGIESWMSSVSFYGNKTITSGEGGCLFTNDTEIYEYLESVKGQGHTNNKFIFDKLGYNYRMTNIQSAILCGQLEDLEYIQDNKRRVFKKYKKELKNVEGVSFQKEEDRTTHSNWLLGIRFNGFDQKRIKEFSQHLFSNHIETRPMFPPINYHKHYNYITKEFPTSEELYGSVLIFPSYPTLLDKEIENICNVIKKYLK